MPRKKGHFLFSRLKKEKKQLDIPFKICYNNYIQRSNHANTNRQLFQVR
jgi:hypothetical protein